MGKNQAFYRQQEERFEATEDSQVEQEQSDADHDEAADAERPVQLGHLDEVIEPSGFPEALEHVGEGDGFALRWRNRVVINHVGFQNGDDVSVVELLPHRERRPQCLDGGGDAQLEFRLAAGFQRLACAVLVVVVFDFQDAHGASRAVGLARLEGGLVHHGGVRPDVFDSDQAARGILLAGEDAIVGLVEDRTDLFGLDGEGGSANLLLCHGQQAKAQQRG